MSEPHATQNTTTATAEAAAAGSSKPRSKKDVGPPAMLDGGRRKVYQVNGAPFVVDARYDVTRVLGCGAYGTVVSAYDTESRNRVAIKKLSEVFSDMIDGVRVLREIRILTSVDHPNILKLRTVLMPPDPLSFRDVYLVTALLDADLHQIISGRQKLVDSHFRTFMVQLFRALKYLHTGNIVHRDVKPANILVTEACDIVLCDFGLARTVDAISLTSHVATRWYRAPELLVMSTHYSFPVDMWSAGCVLGELLLRRPMFQGSNYLHQLHLAVRLIGTPSEADLVGLPAEAQTYLRSLPRTPQADFAVAFPGAKPAAVDLLRRCLTFRAEARITAEQGLRHAYLARYADPAKEPESPSQLAFAEEGADTTDATTLRRALLAAIDRVHAGGPDVCLAALSSPCGPVGESGGDSASDFPATPTDGMRGASTRSLLPAAEATNATVRPPPPAATGPES